MATLSSQHDFIVWGIDQTPYGPVELPTLVSWVKDERVTADTWIFAGKTCAWQRAGELPELQMFFHRNNGSGKALAVSPRGVISGRCAGLRFWRR